MENKTRYSISQIAEICGVSKATVSRMIGVVVPDVSNFFYPKIIRGISDYLEEVIDLVRQGKHFGIDCFYNKRLDIRYLGNMHNRKRCINNTRHGVMKGGIRRHEKDENELEVIIDGLNLARAMTFKNIAGEQHGCLRIPGILPG